MSKEQILGDKSQNQKNNNFDNCFFSSVWRQLCSEGSKTIRVTSQTRTESIFYPCWDPGNHQSMARGKTEKRVAWGTKQRRQAEVQLECIGIRYSFIWHHMHGISFDIICMVYWMFMHVLVLFIVYVISLSVSEWEGEFWVFKGILLITNTTSKVNIKYSAITMYAKTPVSIQEA